MARRWYYKELSETIGPVRSSELVTLARAGHIGPDTPVRRGEEGRWVPAARVKGLAQVTGSTPLTAEQDNLGKRVSDRLDRHTQITEDTADA